MSLGTRFLTLLMAVLTLFLLTSCGEDEPAPANYERPAATMARAISLGDTKSYLNCFTHDAREAYINGENYNKNLVNTFLPSKTGTLIKTATTDDKALSADEIKKLEKQYKDKYKKRIDITKARKINVDFIINGETKLYETKELTVVRVENSWLVFGDVIEFFNFEKR